MSHTLIQRVSATCSSCIADDPSRVTEVTASAGKSGEEFQVRYTNTKVVGNGSFGVVFAAKMLGA